MTTQVDLLLSPAELGRLGTEDLSDTTCVVFDVLRATSTMVTALHHGAREMIVVETIEEALNQRATDPTVLLAGERGGQRIRAAQTGSIDFDLGNSPREFTREAVADRGIVLTTTNGTCALRCCRGAAFILAASFLNLGATARALADRRTGRLILVCAGTGQAVSLEDALGAGALISRLEKPLFDTSLDACRIAGELYHRLGSDLEQAFEHTTNGRRLRADPRLAADIPFCTRQDVFAHPVQMVDNVARIRPRRSTLQSS